MEKIEAKILYEYYFFSFIFFSYFLFLKNQRKAQDALCSLLLLMGVVLMTARVHAEEKIDGLLLLDFASISSLPYLGVFSF